MICELFKHRLDEFEVTGATVKEIAEHLRSIGYDGPREAVRLSGSGFIVGTVGPHGWFESLGFDGLVEKCRQNNEPQ